MFPRIQDRTEVHISTKRKGGKKTGSPFLIARGNLPRTMSLAVFCKPLVHTLKR